MNAILAVYLGAPNDTNGNPRRGWAIYDVDGDFVSFVDEGYAGQGVLQIAYPGIKSTGRIDITPAQYRSLRKQG